MLVCALYSITAPEVQSQRVRAQMDLMAVGLGWRPRTNAHLARLGHGAAAEESLDAQEATSRQVAHQATIVPVLRPAQRVLPTRQHWLEGAMEFRPVFVSQVTTTAHHSMGMRVSLQDLIAAGALTEPTRPLLA